MSKFLQRIGTKKEKFLIAMTIVSLRMNVTEPIDKVGIEWRRGDKISLTKHLHTMKIDETFQKLSVFYHDGKKFQFQKKDVLIKVIGVVQQKPKLLGEVLFDISDLVGITNHEKTLSLNKCPYSDSEIRIKISIMKEYDKFEHQHASSDEDQLYKIKEFNEDKKHYDLSNSKDDSPEKNQLIEKNRQLEQQVQNLQNILKSNDDNEQIQQLQQLITKLEDENDQLKQKLRITESKLSNQSQQSIQQQQHYIENLEKEVQLLSKKYAEYEQKIDLNQMPSNLDDKDMKIFVQELQEKMKISEKQVESKDYELSKLKQEIQFLKKQLEDATKEQKNFFDMDRFS